MIPKDEKVIFSVSQLNRRAKQLLETHLPLVWLSGELSSLSRPSSGHWYFSLKDDRAQVRCAMFKSANQRLRWQVEAGKQVLVRARVSLYEGRGDYQLIVEHMEEAGTGALQRAYEDLKTKLQNEGLFDAARKQALPKAPQHIGVITSPTGAAIQDILSVLNRRYPIASITILPVAVQGAQAANELSHAITKAEHSSLFELLIITRGGGSMEDLWPFNDETLARKIAECSIPIDHIIANKAKQVSAYQKRLRHPKERIAAQHQRCTNYSVRLQQAIGYYLQNTTTQLSHQTSRIQQVSPANIIAQKQQSLQSQSKNLQESMNRQLKNQHDAIAQKAGLLEAVSPLKVLSRGYAVVKNERGQAIISASQLDASETLTTELSNGSFTSKVVKITQSPKV